MMCKGLLFFWYILQVSVWLRICLCAFEHNISVWISLLGILCLFMVVCFLQCTFCAHTVPVCVAFHLIVLFSCFLGWTIKGVFFECIRYIISFHSNCAFANVKFILNGYTGAILHLVDVNLCYMEWMDILSACSVYVCSLGTHAPVAYRKRCFALKIICACLMCCKCVFVSVGVTACVHGV